MNTQNISTQVVFIFKRKLLPKMNIINDIKANDSIIMKANV